MSFHLEASKTNGDAKVCACSLALMERLKTTQKWPLAWGSLLGICSLFEYYFVKCAMRKPFHCQLRSQFLHSFLFCLFLVLDDVCVCFFFILWESRCPLQFAMQLTCNYGQITNGISTLQGCLKLWITSCLLVTDVAVKIALLSICIQWCFDKNLVLFCHLLLKLMLTCVASDHMYQLWCRQTVISDNMYNPWQNCWNTSKWMQTLTVKIWTGITLSLFPHQFGFAAEKHYQKK